MADFFVDIDTVPVEVASLEGGDASGFATATPAVTAEASESRLVAMYEDALDRLRRDDKEGAEGAWVCDVFALVSMPVCARTFALVGLPGAAHTIVTRLIWSRLSLGPIEVNKSGFQGGQGSVSN